MKLLPLAEDFDAADVTVPEGWIQKDIKDMVHEAQERMQFLLKSRINALDLAIENFSRVKFAVASLPAWADNAPYFDFINNKMQTQLDSSEDVKLRSRLEWENSVKTRTGNRRVKQTPRSVTGSARSNTVLTTPAMLAISEGTTEKRIQRTTATKRKANDFAAPPTLSTTAKCSTRMQRAAQPAVSSTPIQQPSEDQTLFVVPSSTRGRATRSRKVATSRLNAARVLLPGDKLLSANGSPVQNPFNLHYAHNRQKPSPKGLEQYYQLVGAISSYLKDVG